MDASDPIRPSKNSCGTGAVHIWVPAQGRDDRRALPAAGAVLALTVAVTAAWAFVLLHRSSALVPWLAPLVLVVGLAVALALAFVTLLPARVVAAVAAVAVLTSMAGPAAYALQTASQPHTGSIPTAGPAVAGARGGPGGARAAFGPGGPTGAAPGPDRGANLGPAAAVGGNGGGIGGLLAASRSAPRCRRCWRRTPRRTPGWRRRSGRTTRPATSWPPACP